MTMYFLETLYNYAKRMGKTLLLRKTKKINLTDRNLGGIDYGTIIS